jgi:hypothetical protein
VFANSGTYCTLITAYLEYQLNFYCTVRT